MTGDLSKAAAAVDQDVFACALTDADVVRGCAPKQPDEVQVGQNWMCCSDGTVLPVKIAHADGPVYLGGETFALGVWPDDLRAEWVCIDAPDNVVAINRG